jgi:deazaflavin-dependent oxidoreductase (nitroreductase family)
VDFNEWNKAIIQEFRANGGQVGGQFANMPLLLLHTTGAKSGQPRVNPLAYLEDNDRYVVIASKAGAPSNPDWYYNVVANPEISIEVGTKEVDVVATVAEEPERTELFAKMVAKNPGFADYEAATTRVIPVILLTPAS